MEKTVALAVHRTHYCPQLGLLCYNITTPIRDSITHVPLGEHVGQLHIVFDPCEQSLVPRNVNYIWVTFICFQMYKFNDH